MNSLSQQKKFSLAGRRVLCTGAAGGLGTGMTLELLMGGAHVFALDISQTGLQALSAALPKNLPGKLNLLQCDLSKIDELQTTLNSVLASGAIDVLINNAAIYPSKPFEEYSIEEMRQVHAVNVEAALVCAQAVLPAMRDQSWGRIVNISSITFGGGWENLAPYVQSKGAMVGLTRAWAREFGKWGITVNAVAPGAFPTEAEKIHPNPEEYAEYVITNQSVKHRGSPDDIANTILFLASNEAGFITGQCLNVDGGWRMS